MDDRSNAAPRLGRTLSGGFLMGLANLVPGVSGGTLILALGLYDRFIGAIADVTRLRWRRETLVFLGVLVLGAGAAILTLSGVAVGLIGSHRWIMYSLFIGLALGGVPELLPLCRPLRAPSVVGVLAGLGLMAWLAYGVSATAIPQTTPVLVLVGALAASSMILPGISGSYILLILGMYDLVIGSLSGTELREDLAGSLAIIAPVGVGAVLGIALLSNFLKFLLARWSRASHAVLLGLLLGSVLGLYPFQEPVHPELVDKPYRKALTMLVAGESLDVIEAARGIHFEEAEAARLRATWAGSSAGDLKSKSEELRRFTPGAPDVLGALGLLVAGYLLARFLGRGGRASGAAPVDPTGNRE